MDSDLRTLFLQLFESRGARFGVNVIGIEHGLSNLLAQELRATSTQAVDPGLNGR